MKSFFIILFVFLGLSANVAFASSVNNNSNHNLKNVENCIYSLSLCLYQSKNKLGHRVFVGNNSASEEQTFKGNAIKTGWGFNLSKKDFVLKYQWKM